MFFFPLLKSLCQQGLICRSLSFMLSPSLACQQQSHAAGHTPTRLEKKLARFQKADFLSVPNVHMYLTGSRQSHSCKQMQVGVLVNKKNKKGNEHPQRVSQRVLGDESEELTVGLLKEVCPGVDRRTKATNTEQTTFEPPRWNLHQQCLAGHNSQSLEGRCGAVCTFWC